MLANTKLLFDVYLNACHLVIYILLYIMFHPFFYFFIFYSACLLYVAYLKPGACV